MKLLVKMLTGREIEVKVKKTGKVEDIKDYIHRNTGELGGAKIVCTSLFISIDNRKANVLLCNHFYNCKIQA